MAENLRLHARIVVLGDELFRRAVEAAVGRICVARSLGVVQLAMRRRNGSLFARCVRIRKLGVQIPRAVVPLNPGKNITVIAEVIAMMHLLRFTGVDVAAQFNERLIKKMKEKSGVRDYLREDYE